ncbi:MAG: WecB/TagA/CpsF family glycosyltransferase [Cyanobacteria bacterium J06638_22]
MTTQFSSPSPPGLTQDLGFPDIVVLQTRFHQLTCCDLIEYVTSVPQPSPKKIIANVNVRAMNFACDLPWYRDFINRADVVFCDGFGVLLAAKLNGYDLQSEHRMTCPDYIENLAKSCEKQGRSLFLLAGQPGVVETAIAKLKAIAPGLKIDGHHGFFDKTGAENEAVIEKVNQFKPDLLYVGFGMPTQERWILDNIDKIDARVFLPLGACLDFYTGTVRRGPKWLTDNGLEWLSRLLIEPRRLWSRYILGNTRFFLRVFQELCWKALAPKA